MPNSTLVKSNPTFTDIDGTALENGYIYIGTANTNPEITTNQIQVWWDENSTIPATQPIRTINGYPSRSGSPAKMYVSALNDYSITVRNAQRSLVYANATSTDFLVAAGIVEVKKTKITSDQTFTRQIRTKQIEFELIGGGGGAGAKQATSSQVSSSGAGGGGAYIKVLISQSDLEDTYDIVIGDAGAGGITNANGADGGDTTVSGASMVITAAGGKGGGTVAPDAFGTIADGGVGGKGSVASLTTNGMITGLLNGGDGDRGAGSNLVTTPNEGGGNSFFGRGGTGTLEVAASDGENYGGGGGGIDSGIVGTTSAINGADGAPGVVLITEYIYP